MSASLENEMVPTPNLAEWVAQHAIDDRASAAVIDAIRQAHASGLDHPTIEIIRAAAMKHRALLRCVAAALGFLRCAYCHDWIQAWREADADSLTTDECLHVGEADRSDVCAALALWRAVGGPVLASHSLPRLVAERLQQTTGCGGGDHPHAMSPAADTET